MPELALRLVPSLMHMLICVFRQLFLPAVHCQDAKDAQGTASCRASKQENHSMYLAP